MPGLEEMLAGDRFIQGYDSSRKRGMADQEMQLRQATGLAQLLQHIQQQQQAAQLKQALQQSGGDLEKALPALIQSGNLKGAHDLAPLLKLQQEKQMRDKM